MFSRPKRTVPKPEVITSHQSDNPMFQKQPRPELQRFRRRVLSAFGVIIMLILLAVAMYGPWLEVTAVMVTGTRVLDPQSVEAVTRSYLQGTSWLILPRRNVWLLSGSHLSNHLKQRISTKLSVEAVHVSKRYPHRLVVEITERTPVFLWTNGTASATIDRQGVLIELRQQPEPNLNIVRDNLAAPIQPDQQVIIPEVVAALLTLQDALRRNNLTVQEFIIPTPACPLVFPTAETIINANDNDNTHETQGEPTVTNQNANENVNAGPLPVAEPCDLLPLRQKSQEVHVRVKDGPVVLFDRHSNLEAAVTTLVRLLSQPENAKASYFDIRFEERVYIR